MTKLVFAALVAVLSVTSVWAQTAPQPGSPAFDRWVGERLAALQRVADRDAIRQLLYHYGRGNDELSVHHADRQTGARRASAEYERAFTANMQITVYPLRSSQPLRQVMGVPDWIAFAAGFFDQAKYSSTLHLMSNFSIDFTDGDTARGTAYAHVPHYIQSAARDQAGATVAVENMLARYEFTANRQSDGQWRLSRMTIYLDEIQRQTGFFPSGQATGK